MKIIDLSENDIKLKNRQVIELEIKLIALKLQLDQLQRVIEEDLPMKQARFQIIQMNSDIEITEDNIRKLKKQIREKKMEIIEQGG
jgi:hypothetical protein